MEIETAETETDRNTDRVIGIEMEMGDREQTYVDQIQINFSSLRWEEEGGMCALPATLPVCVSKLFKYKSKQKLQP